ncbi:MAG: hypothetical protein AB1755_06670 [Candidatus Omnitrophota bacterium]
MEDTATKLTRIVTTGQGVFAEEGFISAPRRIYLTPDERSQVKLDPSEVDVSTIRNLDKNDKRAILTKFLALITTKTYMQGLELLNDGFVYKTDGATYNKLEFEKMLMVNNRAFIDQSVELIECVSSGKDCLKVVVWNKFKIGQTIWNFNRKNIAVCFDSSGKINHINGEIIPAPNQYTDDYVAKTGDTLNGTVLTRDVVFNANSASSQQSFVNSGTVTLNFNSQSIDLESGTIYPNTSSGDIFFQDAINTNLPTRVSLAGAITQSFESLNDVTPYIALITTNDSLMAPSLPFVVVGKTKEGNYFKIKVIASAPLNYIKFAYTINLAGGTNF